MSDHAIKFEWDGDGYLTTTLVCTAPAGAICHATYDCGCESWNEETVNDGLPEHRDSADNRHVGTTDITKCNLRDWFENSDEPLIGSFTMPVKPQWEGEDYSFDVTPPEGTKP